jgi:mRNA interferase RelE/StbE
VSAAVWRLLYASSARKDLRRLDPPVRKRIVAGLEQLARQGPGGSDLVKLKGRFGARLRVGDWRVIVELDAPSRTIRVKRVLPRGRAYER